MTVSRVGSPDQVVIERLTPDEIIDGNPYCGARGNFESDYYKLNLE